MERGTGYWEGRACRGLEAIQAGRNANGGVLLIAGCSSGQQAVRGRRVELRPLVFILHGVVPDVWDALPLIIADLRQLPLDVRKLLCDLGVLNAVLLDLIL